MKGLKAALWFEILKARRTKVFAVSIIFFAFIGILMGLMLYLSAHPDLAGRSSALQMKTAFLQSEDWQGYYDLMMQIVLIIVLIGSGIITSWAFGREFTDHTLKDLLALPLSRSTFVYAKFILLMAWSFLLSLTILLFSFLCALLIGLEAWDASTFLIFLKNYLLCTLLYILLIPPVAFIASAARGYILPIAFVILILIITQFVFIAAPTLTKWFPYALPALASKVAGNSLPDPGFQSYTIYFLFIIAGVLGSRAWWKLADHK